MSIEGTRPPAYKTLEIQVSDRLLLERENGPGSERRE